MEELPGKVRVQDAVLANMVTLSAMLEYLESIHPGAKAAIDQRALEIARAMKAATDKAKQEDGRE
jgi:hypothetical protein